MKHTNQFVLLIAAGLLSISPSHAQTQTTELGDLANAEDTGSTAIGAMSHAQGNLSTALGFHARTDGDSSVAIGDGARTFDRDAIALGADTQAQAPGSVAIGRTNGGDGAIASLEHQVAIGTGAHTYTTAGITSQLSKDRQSGPVEVVTTDANGNLASAEAASGEQVSENQDDIADNEQAISQNQQGIADNEQRIGQNEQGISENGDDIADNSQGISDNSDRIGQNEQGIADNRDLIFEFAEQGPDLSEIERDIARNAEGIAENKQGVALAVAMENPDLVADEEFAMAVNLGTFEGAQALGFSASGVLSRDFFADGSGARFSVSGSVGYSLEADKKMAGRGGFQLSW